jgi:hypothetical protein
MAVGLDWHGSKSVVWNDGAHTGASCDTANELHVAHRHSLVSATTSGEINGIVTGRDLYHALFGDDDSTDDYDSEEDSASSHRALLAALVQMAQEISAAYCCC